MTNQGGVGSLERQPYPSRTTNLFFSVFSVFSVAKLNSTSDGTKTRMTLPLHRGYGRVLRSAAMSRSS